MSSSILIVDDDAPLAAFASKYLTRVGYEVRTCRSAADAWQVLNTSDVTVAIIDVTLGDSEGEELARRILDSILATRVLLWSGYPFDVLRLSAHKERSGFLQKPFTPPMLVAAVEKLAPRLG
ncbi:MAG: response regulator [Bryobacteraceae bacterium]